MSRSITEIAAGADGIAGKITVVATTATDTTEEVIRTREAVAALTRMAGELQDLVSRFRY
jgi:methyl-accepting chemotaxis protein